MFLLPIICFMGCLSLSYCHSLSNLNTTLVKESNPYHEFNVWVNDIVFHYTTIDVVPNIIDNISDYYSSYYIKCYLRNLIVATSIYWTISGTRHYMIYNHYKNELFIQRQKKIPTLSLIQEQQYNSQYSLLYDAVVPVFADFLIENNITKVYYNVSDIGGWKYYFFYSFLYFSLVEITVYWTHRILHTNKMLYKWIHSYHHKYNRFESLTPWAAFAFSPLDGILQVSPYVIHLFFVPVHYFTFSCLLFMSGIWAINIHDCIFLDSEPIMGAKYHTIHHTHYHYNFGQYFIFCDWLWDTLKESINNKD